MEKMEKVKDKLRCDLPSVLLLRFSDFLKIFLVFPGILV